MLIKGRKKRENSYKNINIIIYNKNKIVSEISEIFSFKNVVYFKV